MAILVSTQVTGSLSVTGQAVAAGFTGSIQGTSSYANVLTATQISATGFTGSLQGTASYANYAVALTTVGINGSFIVQSASLDYFTASFTNGIMTSVV